MHIATIHSVSLPLALVLGLCAGLPTGALHFATLARNLQLFQGGRAALGMAVLALRLVTTAVLLALLIRLGTGAVIGGMAGLLLARQAMVHRLARVRVPHDDPRSGR